MKKSVNVSSRTRLFMAVSHSPSCRAFYSGAKEARIELCQMAGRNMILDGLSSPESGQDAAPGRALARVGTSSRQVVFIASFQRKDAKYAKMIRHEV